jgi:hypothetical protein
VEKPIKKKGNLTALTYLAAYPFIQEVAADCGYALAPHGSLVTDFDIVAIPWTEDALHAEEFIAAYVKRFAEVYAEPIDSVVGPELKPHGRKAWCLAIGSGLYLDISVMPNIGNCYCLPRKIEPVVQTHKVITFDTPLNISNWGYRNLNAALIEQLMEMGKAAFSGYVYEEGTKVVWGVDHRYVGALEKLTGVEIILLNHPLTNNVLIYGMLNSKKELLTHVASLISIEK